jgi:sortase A
MSKTTKIERNGNASRLEQILLVIGLLALNVWVWSMVRTALFQHEESQIFQGELHHLEIKPSPFETRGGKGAPLPIPRNNLVGRLSIPRLGVQAMVREGDTAGTLGVALGHIPGTALPGEQGNVGVAGHRDTLFRSLGGIRRNDTILFETLDGTYQYQVEGTQIVKPSDVGVLKAGNTPELTLVTCYPFNYVGAAPNRFIVKARLTPMNARNHTGSTVAQEKLER